MPSLPLRGRSIAALLVAAAGLGLLARAATQPMDTLKLTPLAVSAAAPDAGKLFDRDTGSAWHPVAAQQVEATLEEAAEIRAVKLYGGSPYLLSVQAQSGAGWQPVAGLQQVDLSKLPDGWNLLPAATPVTTARLRFDFTPSGNAAGAIREIEIWGAAQRSVIGSAEQMLAAVGNQPLPLQGRVYAAAEPAGYIGPNGNVPDDVSDNQFTVQLDRAPSDFKRAWLVHTAKGLSHWSAGLRSINGQAAQGGAYLARSETWTTWTEEINPAWLVRGANRIVFSAGASGSYSVRDVRLMVEMEDGTNFVQPIASTDAASAAIDGDPTTGWAPYPGKQPATSATLDLRFAKPTQVDGLRLNLGGGEIFGSLRVSFLTNGAWVDSGYAALDAHKLKNNWNELAYPSRVAVDGVRLAFANGSGNGEVRELMVTGSGAGPRQGAPAVQLSYPDNGQFVGREAYIRGFVTPADNGSGPVRIYVGGSEVEQTDGAFGALVGKDELGLTAQADSAPWSVEVRAVYRDGAEVRRMVQLTRYTAPSTARSDGDTSQFVHVPPGKLRVLGFGGAKLKIGADALDKDLTFGITPLVDTDLPRLDTGMTNVTKGPHKGYRFTPHGAHFKNKIEVSLPYDRAAIPAGQTEQDVHTYYFDDQAGSWKMLERAQVDAAGGMIVSYTNHFTDMINATVTVPDHPNPASLNPTSIKDIKAADPGAGINLIDPPKPNSMGDARLSYPIELPPGRNGMQPGLAVQYNSGGGNGWMGLGWDVAMQSVSIDTRWGVPRYDKALETESYVLDGEALTPVAHRGVLKPRSIDKTFHTRIEGQFRRIVRHGDSPASYWWEVTDKSGTKFFYGGRPEGGLDKNAVLADPGNGNLFRWALKEVRDTNGNNIQYQYDVVDGGSGGEPWRQIYLKRVYYTGSRGAQGPYEVVFQRAGGRIDVTVDGRAGFKTLMDQRLTGIDVNLTGQANPLVRRYAFTYATAAFNKTVLTQLTQYGEDGVTEFNHHGFEYYDEARDSAGNYHGFAAPVDWSIGSDNISAGLLGKGMASALGGVRGSSVGGHLYVGVGPMGSLGSKERTGGLKVGYSRSTSESLIAMADMDGDGLPDKVFKGGNGFYYRKNLSGPHGGARFDDQAVALPSLPAISREKVTSTTFGGEEYFGLPVTTDVNRSTSRADTYFTDVNGDGITDLVSGGKVLFGYINASGVPTFSSNSADTPVAIGTGVVDTTSLLDETAASGVEAENAANYPLIDTVRRWVAPYDGVVQINAPVQLLEDKSKARALYDGADGVRVAIQLEGAELWSTKIGPTDYTVHAPAGVASVPVRRGDRLYFRVQSIVDGAYDAVAWNAQVSYLNADTARTDVNGLPAFVFNSGTEFTLAGRKGDVTVPVAGKLHLGGQWQKTGATTDDVTLLVTKNGTDIIRRTLGFADTAVVDLSSDIDVAQGDVLAWRILADSPIDASRVKLAPAAWYTSAQGVGNVIGTDGKPTLQLRPPYQIDLYPVNALTAPQGSYKVAAAATLQVNASVRLANLASGETASAVLTVKRRGALLAKRVLDFTASAPQIDFTLDVPAAAADELFFDLSSRDPAFPSRVSLADVKVGDTAVPLAVNAPAVDGLFPQPYRGWGAAGYNGNAERATQPIDQAALVMDDKYDPKNARAYPFLPWQPESARNQSPDADQQEVPAWLPDTVLGGVDDGAWAAGVQLSASRLGLDDIRTVRSAQFAGASAVARISQSTNTGFGAGISAGQGKSHSQLDFQDMNGDRFPDVVGERGVQFTRPSGALEGPAMNVGLGSARESNSETLGVDSSGAANLMVAIANAAGRVGAPAASAFQGSDMPALGYSAGIGKGKSDAEHELIDINGDGLPDKVYNDGTAALNLGYRFGAREPWDGGVINKGATTDINGGISASYNQYFYSWAGGLNLTVGESTSNESYVDINGDGLPDKVIAGQPMKVRLNTGAGFTAEIPWPHKQDGDEIANDKHISLGGGAYFTVGFPIYAARIVFNPGINFSTSMGRPEVGFRDMDGDGYVDYVSSNKDDQLSVGGNAIGRTNLLKRITRPLGATIELEYARDGNTYEQPQSKWLLTKTSVFDGHPGDGVDTLVNTYEYENAHYDRAEREFYGYAKVIESQSDAGHGDAVYRRSISEYLNADYYTKGLLTHTVMEDAAGRAYTEMRQQYAPVTVADDAAVPGDEGRSATVFPQLIRTEQAWYEGLGSAGKQTYTTHRFDELGNVVEFFDAGDAGADDDVRATIAYTQDTANYIVGKPTQIVVEGAGRVMRRREASYASGTGNLVQVRQYLNSSQAAVTDLGYTADGNLQSVTGPANQRGQRYRIDYAYDPVVATHIVGITDSFGLGSTATVNYKHGKVTRTLDTNGNPTDYSYDQFGRTVAITGPYQTGGEATLRFEYHPEAATPWARTRHLDVFRNAADPIDTVLFTDGIKRVIQTKKDISLFTGANTAPVDMMSVSGHVTYDGFGRTIAQSYPVTEPLGSPGVFNGAVDAIAPTRTEYDVLDRATRTVLPDNTITSMEYGFGADRKGQQQFRTIVTDANGKRKISYRDVQELISSVQEFNQGQSIWTSYSYDALKQITEVKDDRGNLTRAEYDNLGRRTSLDNPDTGRTDSEFDLAGNLVAKVTANLRGQNKAIRYTYDYQRLTNVTYPEFTGNNVTYRYGGPGAPFNRAGRIIDVTSEAGTEERFYGKMGEVVKETRTIASDTQGKSPNSPEVWTTEYLFDTFGRLQRLAYPDGEVLVYGYDAGGNLSFAQGQKGSQFITYLTRLEYDKFEQRQYLAYGNGSHTSYSYDARNRRLTKLQAMSQGSTFQNLGYRYDNVGNILGLQNQVPVPPASSYGGPTSQSFVYDDLYRLVQAQGSYDFAPNKRDRYSLAMAYDSIHNITGKTQVHDIVGPGGQAIGQKKTSYAWAYDYNSSRPHAPTHLGERSYKYDADGNQLGWDHDKNGTRRNIVWDEENRIQAIFDNGQQQSYKYDDDGERIIKRGPQGETVYVNQWFTVRNREIASKHVFAGSTRIATDMVMGVKPAAARDLASVMPLGGTSSWGGTGPTSGPVPSGSPPPAPWSKLPLPAQQAPGILKGTGLANLMAKAAGNARALEMNPHYATGAPSGGPVGGTAGGLPGVIAAVQTPAGSLDNFLYFYHPDHLASSSYVTDATGKLYQHMEYFPFGETWVDERSNTQRTPYLFTGKELDEETGLYYYGARYYDPRTSVWQSPDPILGNYLPNRLQEHDLAGSGGIYNPSNIAVFGYGRQNPIKYVDPDGKLAIPWHFGITYKAARDSGMSFTASVALAYQTTAVDWRDHSQDQEAEHTRAHAMAGKLPGGFYQTKNEAIAETKKYIAESVAAGATTGAIHASEDIPAGGHEGREWKGFTWSPIPLSKDIFDAKAVRDHFNRFKETVSHLANDILSSLHVIDEAYKNALSIIKETPKPVD